MLIPLVLLVLVAVIGSIDGLYFHLYKYRLALRPSCRAETLTHVLRAVTLALGLAILATRVPTGGWFWALAVVFAVDLADDVIDVLLEPASRAPLGGLEGPEYLIHMVVMALSGAIWTSYLLAGWAGRHAASVLVAVDHASWLVWCAWGLAAGALALGMVESQLLAWSWLGASRRPARSVGP